MRAGWLAWAAVLILAGCGADIETGYGVVGEESVNGFSVLEGVWRERFEADDLFRLSERSADYRTLIHLQRHPDAIRDEAWDHLEDWLAAGGPRQCVVVLRDGAVADWLLGRWIAEIDQALAQEGVEGKERLRRMRKAIRKRRSEEYEPRPVAVGGVRKGLGHRVEGIPTLRPERLSGTVEGPAPPMMKLRSQLAGEDIRPLIRADGRVWAAEVPRGRSRLVVVAGATPLLDAAQVDPDARRVLRSLTEEIARFDDGPCALVTWMRVRQPAPPPPSILRQLFASSPFASLSIHVLALLLLYVWFKAAWLGRINPAPGEPLKRFSRHVDALGWRLGQLGDWRSCLTAVARWTRRTPPKMVTGAEEAGKAVHAMLTQSAADPTAAQGGDSDERSD